MNQSVVLLAFAKWLFAFVLDADTKVVDEHALKARLEVERGCARRDSAGSEARASPCLNSDPIFTPWTDLFRASTVEIHDQPNIGHASKHGRDSTPLILIILIFFEGFGF